mmetsp:Transcript_22953/g.53581  ORF Transcript_22953/g.53581 Transcript_22953/m.53581 type:complete len:247 (+) Transcript_22953:789-1529(+)
MYMFKEAAISSGWYSTGRPTSGFSWALTPPTNVATNTPGIDGMCLIIASATVSPKPSLLLNCRRTRAPVCNALTSAWFICRPVREPSRVCRIVTLVRWREAMHLYSDVRWPGVSDTAVSRTGWSSAAWALTASTVCCETNPTSWREAIISSIGCPRISMTSARTALIASGLNRCSLLILSTMISSRLLSASSSRWMRLRISCLPCIQGGNSDTGRACTYDRIRRHRRMPEGLSPGMEAAKTKRPLV